MWLDEDIILSIVLILFGILTALILPCMCVSTTIFVFFIIWNVNNSPYFI